MAKGSTSTKPKRGGSKEAATKVAKEEAEETVEDTKKKAPTAQKRPELKHSV